MTIALIDNGSLEPAAHLNLRRVAAALSGQAGVAVHAVSWKHSDLIPAAALSASDEAAHFGESTESVRTLGPWLRMQRARGEVDFVFVPFFVSAQGSIGSALRDDLEALRRETGHFEFAITDGLAARGAMVRIVAERIRETITAEVLSVPAIIIVDHGGPASASAALRDEVATQIKGELGDEVGALTAASMEGADCAHNHPLLADQLARPGFNRGDVVIAPLFLSPGRHAGPNGDLAQIARAACLEAIEQARPELVERADDRVTPRLRCHFTGLVGTHPHAVDALATALRHTLSTFSNHAAA